MGNSIQLGTIVIDPLNGRQIRTQLFNGICDILEQNRHIDPYNNFLDLKTYEENNEEEKREKKTILGSIKLIMRELKNRTGIEVMINYQRPLCCSSNEIRSTYYINVIDSYYLIENLDARRLVNALYEKNEDLPKFKRLLLTGASPGNWAAITTVINDSENKIIQNNRYILNQLIVERMEMNYRMFR